MPATQMEMKISISRVGNDYIDSRQTLHYEVLPIIDIANQTPVIASTNNLGCYYTRENIPKVP